MLTFEFDRKNWETKTGTVTIVTVESEVINRQEELMEVTNFSSLTIHYFAILSRLQRVKGYNSSKSSFSRMEQFTKVRNMPFKFAGYSISIDESSDP